MTTIRKTITLTDTQSDWVRKDQERNAWPHQLCAALLEGEQSGLSDRTPQEIREAARERLIKDGNYTPL